MMVTTTPAKMCISPILMCNTIISPNSIYHYKYSQKSAKVGFAIMLIFPHFIKSINNIRIASGLIETTTKVKWNSSKQTYLL